MSLTAVAESLKNSRRVAIVSHTTPDGDAVGSSLALWEAVKALGKEAGIFSADTLPYIYAFLPHASQWQKVKALPGDYDTVAVLECAHLGRTGDLITAPGNPEDASPVAGEGEKKPAPVIINIDHHLNNQKYGRANWVEEGAPAVAEMIYRLLPALGVRLTPAMATNLLAAIVTDTGSFRYSSTTPAVLRAAAHLLEAGADIAALNESLNYQKRPTELRLLGRVLDTLEVEPEYGLAWMEVTQKMLQATGSAMEETEEFTSLPRSLQGVKVAVLFKEIEPRLTKVSFRSKGRVDVSVIARGFGGGGHENAAGCRWESPLEETKQRVLAATRKYLKKYKV